VAALLYAWNIGQAGYAPLYSEAVRAMSESWKAFFYGAANVHATMTLDKLAGSFLPEALAARIFGFHAWSLALPQVIEGVVTVLVMYRVVRRWAGVVPGILAAAVLALTPIAASMFGHSMEDGALTMCLVLAADAYQRAVLEGRLGPLVWAGMWVGLGFQAKMMQAWMILPALTVGYLLTASIPVRRRLWHIGVAGGVMLAVSLSWVALYTFTPANDRPYIAGSTNNSAVAMVFGWNGVGRFNIRIPGAPPPSDFGSAPAPRPAGSAARPAAPAPQQAGPPPGQGLGIRVGPSGGRQGWAKLLGDRFGPEIGWLYPLALLTLIFGLGWRRRAAHTDQVRGGLVMWGIWLLTFGFVFSAMSTVPHTAYVASLAPAVAALAGAGIVMFWQAFRLGGRRGWVFPLAVAAELAWAGWLWSAYRGFLPWALWAAEATGVVAIAVLVAALMPNRTRTRLAAGALAAGAAAMLAAPATWAASVLDVKYAGTSFDASAGPVPRPQCSLTVSGPTGSGSGNGCAHPTERSGTQPGTARRHAQI
jgi:4-amino-4-deoxy-L-arabinose transferase-like glycosyltransferase